MKKWTLLLLSLLLMFSLTACGGDEEPAPAETAPPASSQQEPAPAPAPEPAEAPSDVSGYLGTKTGKFYSRFADGKLYMEYEMTMEGETIRIISATDGQRIYSDTQMGGVSVGTTVMEGDTLYTIDHASKMVIKMTSPMTDASAMASTILEESDVDMNDYKTGSREIDGVTYDTEEWVVEGASAVMCFDGDDLAYMISVLEGEEYLIKVIEVSDDVDDSLFEIPSDYQMMSI